MKDTLTKILDNKVEEVKILKQEQSLASLEKLAKDAPLARDFLQALSFGPMPRVIAECKQKSPSRGVLKAPYHCGEIAKKYELGGAVAISVLTDQVFFGGKIDDLSLVRSQVRLPILRKDFIIDPYQVYQSRAFGADSFLLIGGTLDRQMIDELLEIGRSLKMEALVEAHDEHDLEIVLASSAKIVGINNRNLRDFAVNFSLSKSLVKKIISAGRIAICESGIKNRDDIRVMESLGFTGFLIGETLVTSNDAEQTMRSLIS